MPTLEERLEASLKEVARLQKKVDDKKKRESAEEAERKRKAMPRASIVMMAELQKAAKQDGALAAAIQRAAEAVSRPGDIKALQTLGWLPKPTSEPVEETTKSESESESEPVAAAPARRPKLSQERLLEMVADRRRWHSKAQYAFADFKRDLNDERRGAAQVRLRGLVKDEGMTLTQAKAIVDQLLEIGEGHPDALRMLEQEIDDLTQR